MPIGAAEGILEVENAKFSASEFIATTSVGIGTTSASAYPLVIFKETEPEIRIQEGDAQSSGARFYSNNSNLYIQTGTDFSSGSSGDIAFQTMGGQSTHVIVKGDGKVGVGTGSPVGLLDIRASSTDPGALPTVHVGDGTTVADAGDYGMVNLVRHATTGGSKCHLAFVRSGQNVAGMGYYNNTNTLGIWNAFSSVTDTPSLSVERGGNVGIGTETPGAVLHVHGSENTGASTIAMSIDRWKIKTWAGNLTGGNPVTDTITIFDRSARGSSNGGEIAGEVTVVVHRGGNNQQRAYAKYHVNYTHWSGTTWYGNANEIHNYNTNGITNITLTNDGAAGKIYINITGNVGVSGPTGQYYIKFDGPVYLP